ncbi:MAG: branched-chain amino acid ABC transporter substrate-binding protein [Coriobacteriia bacterium]|nr:branched-chain amino acid ABC transporter substrate-binding protein [Coriobacteriia bacterium]
MQYAIRKFAVVAAVVALGATMMTGCSKPAATTEPGAPAEAKAVKVGFAAPLTGDNAIYGQGMKRAVELAIEEVNASEAAKTAGMTFELRAEDDMGDPKQAVNVANLLVSDTSVVGIVGHFNSGCSIPASPVYNRAKLAMVTVSSNPALTAAGLPNVNRVVAKDDAQGAAAGELVATKLGLKNVAVIDDSTPYGQGLAEQFVKAFTAAGGTVVMEEHVQANDVDFGAIVTRMKGKKPEAIYYAGGLNQGALLSKQSKEAGLKVPLIGGDMIYAADFVKIAGKANAEGDIATALGLPLDQQPKGAEFTEKYTAKFGEEPQAYDSYAYDAAWLVMNAAMDAGADRAAVVAAVRGSMLDGVTGQIAFDANGDNKQQIISQYQVTDGEWKQLK